MKKRKALVAAVGALALLAGACGGGDAAGAGGEHGDHSEGKGDDHDAAASQFSFGKPADPAEADRTITVTGSDELRFEPAAIEVEVGETIAFEFVNEGKGPHEFVLGDRAALDEHGGGHGGHEGSAPNATDEVGAGSSQTIAWTFTEPGEVLYECHVADHHEQGMRGTITVS